VQDERSELIMTGGNADADLQAADMAYLSRTKMDEVLANLMQEVLIARPDDPLQFMIEYIKQAPQLAAASESTKGATDAAQDVPPAESTDGVAEWEALLTSSVAALLKRFEAATATLEVFAVRRCKIILRRHLALTWDH
jgi:hypothetical protein